MNVVDALVITLGLDTKDFERGQKRTSADMDKMKKQSDAVAKEMAIQGKKAAEFFSSIKVELLGVLATFGAATGIKDFIASNVQGQAALGRLSTNLGISAKELEAWGLVAKEMGGTTQDAFGALQSVASGLAEASIKGHSALTDMAGANGVALVDGKDKVLSYEEALISISRRMQDLPRQQALYLANQLGVGSLFNELELGPDELRKRLDAARGLSGATEASTKAAMRLQKEWADIQQRFKKTSETAFAKLSPVLERLAERFANFLDSVDWAKVAKQIGVLADKANGVVHAFGGWKTVAIVLGGILALKVLSPVLGLIGGLIRLIPLIASTTAGLSALSLAGQGIVISITAVVGWKIGKLIYDQIADTQFGRALGAFEARVLSLLGDKTATDAVQANQPGFEGGHVSNTRVKQLDSLYRVRQARDTERIHELDALYRVRHPLPRGIRNNNPGNLNFAHQAGAHLESGPHARFAAFDTLQEGIAAMAKQLVRYVAGGTDTIRKIVAKYAPASDNNDVNAYIADLVKRTGDSPDQKLGGADLLPILKAIIAHEGNGKFVTDDDIRKGIRLGATQSAMAHQISHSTSTSTAETHITGPITIQTKATDAKGIAASFKAAVNDRLMVAQSDTGLA